MSKKAERRWRTSKVVAKRVPFLKRIYGEREIPASKYGRCRDRHPFDCGNSRCVCCHSDKLLDIRPVQRLASDLDFKEQLDDLTQHGE